MDVHSYLLGVILAVFALNLTRGIEISEMMPATCQRLMKTMAKNSTNTRYTEEQRSASEVGELASFCPSQSALLACISENLFEMRQSEDPIQWAFSVMFEAKHVIEKANATCRLFDHIENTSGYKCLDVTNTKRQQCRTQLESNLVYLRQNMDPDSPTLLVQHTVCFAFYEFVTCQDLALNEFCETSITHLLAFSNTIFAFADCKNPDKAVQIHQLMLNESAIAKCGLQDMTFYWTGQNDVDFSRLYSGVKKSCYRLDTIQNCLTDSFTTPNSHVDKMAREAVNVETIINALHIMCRSHKKLDGQEQCLEEVNNYGSFCITFTKGTMMAESILAGHDLIQCAHFRDLIRCMSTQIRRCDGDLARDFLDAYMLEIKSNPKCNGKEFPTGQLAGSTLIHCGAAIATKSVEIGEKQFKEGLLPTPESVGSLLSFACQEVPWYLKCIAPSLLASDGNKLDSFMQTILYLDDTSALEKTMNAVCQQKSRIIENLDCLIEKKPQLRSCITDYVMSVLAKMTNLTSMQPNSRGAQLACNHIHDIAQCAVKVIGTCDAKLGALAEQAKNNLVRSKTCGRRTSAAADASAADDPSNRSRATGVLSSNNFMSTILMVIVTIHGLWILRH